MLALPAGAAADESFLSVSNPSVVEGNSGTALLEFTLSGSCGHPTQDCSLQWQTADGTATLADGDYVQTSGSVAVTKAAPFSQQVSVPVNGDLNVEPGETVLLNVTVQDQLALPPSASGTGTIVNDDDGSTPDPDPDVDGVLAPGDNCPVTPNPDRAELDGDGAGDACDDDLDGDGVANVQDNCAQKANADQIDVNGNKVGDACDPQVGGSGDDRVFGTSGDDVQVGGQGGDAQFGGAGNDVQFGGSCFTAQSWFFGTGGAGGDAGAGGNGGNGGTAGGFWFFGNGGAGGQGGAGGTGGQGGNGGDGGQGGNSGNQAFQFDVNCLIRQIFCPVLTKLHNGFLESPFFEGFLGRILSSLLAVYDCPVATKQPARAGATAVRLTAGRG